MKKIDGIRNALKTVKHRKPTQFFCPRCASSKIGLNSGLDIWLTPRQYRCDSCGYTGILVMEMEEDTHPQEPETS
jgi:transcription elongation factor Elf1